MSKTYSSVRASPRVLTHGTTWAQAPDQVPSASYHHIAPPGQPRALGPTFVSQILSQPVYQARATNRTLMSAPMRQVRLGRHQAHHIIISPHQASPAHSGRHSCPKSCPNLYIRLGQQIGHLCQPQCARSACRYLGTVWGRVGASWLVLGLGASWALGRS